ncbi:HAD hydrolase-like protein [bacterium]|nr:HAD hydrolase-like protein [bacterium]
MKPSDSLIVFDLDGTLVDAFGDIRASVNQALARRNLPTHDIEAIRGFVGNGLRKLCERATPPEARDQLNEILAETREYYAKHPVDHARLYPGVEKLLLDLRRLGAKTSVLSNKTDELVQMIAAHLGLSDLVDRVLGERAGVPIKPDPAALHELRDFFGAKLVVLVGDGLPDAKVAQRGGAHFIGVGWGIEPAPVLEGFGTVVDEVPRIYDVVQRLLEDCPE